MAASEQRLSPILPIVFYTGRRAWEGASLKDIVPAPPELAPFLPVFDSVFFSVTTVELGRLTAGGDPLGWLLRLFRLDEAPAEEVIRALEQAIDKMEALARGGELERWLHLATFVIGYICHRRPVEESGTLLEAVRQRVRDPKRRQEVEVMAKTSAEVWEEKGRIEGKIEGKIEGLRQALLRQLRSKFGPISREVEQRIEALTDISRLDTLLERVLTAASIDEMGL
ncbi:MAG: DUF4351 domain-containing protein [Planctomycetes bacterium]|nr:DUF4351 domain-containing protein [Planctomycetota bacterium]